MSEENMAPLHNINGAALEIAKEVVMENRIGLGDSTPTKVIATMTGVERSAGDLKAVDFYIQNILVGTALEVDPEEHPDMYQVSFPTEVKTRFGSIEDAISFAFLATGTDPTSTLQEMVDLRAKAEEAEMEMQKLL